jgi:hypothetical protein
MSALSSLCATQHSPSPRCRSYWLFVRPCKDAATQCWNPSGRCIVFLRCCFCCFKVATSDAKGRERSSVWLPLDASFCLHLLATPWKGACKKQMGFLAANNSHAFAALLCLNGLRLQRRVASCALSIQHPYCMLLLPCFVPHASCGHLSVDTPSAVIEDCAFWRLNNIGCSDVLTAACA